MMHLLLRRTATPSFFSSGRAVIASVDTILLLPHPSRPSDVGHSSPCAVLDMPLPLPTLKSGVRGFHAPALPLGFRDTPAASARFAVADYGSCDEDKSSNGSGAGDDVLEIARLGISEEIVSALDKKGITKLFPIQKAVLEPAMLGRDMIGRARTGTGKTLAFGIPIMDKITKYNAKHGKGRNPLAVILAPTRELARQVEKEFYESAPNLDTICVYGGTPIQQQMRQLDYGVDVVVGTPGRVIDLIKRGALNLSEVQFAVLDEADQMLAVGFEEDVETILQNLPKNRQSMMFSATMPNWIQGLTRKYLKDPLTIDLVGDSDQKLADGISLYTIVSDLYSKAGIIGPLITVRSQILVNMGAVGCIDSLIVEITPRRRREHAKGGKCIVFTQTKRDADRLAHAMGKSYKCEALHGDISQAQRERTLAGFREGHFNILVATDVAARGLDVPNVDLVIHYEIPNSPETFVHRSGRTGRAGKKGSAILIYTQDQNRAVKLIEREAGCRFTELPKIAVDGASIDMFSMSSGVGGGGRFNSFGGGRDRRSGDFGFGRSSRGSDFGRGGGDRFGGPSSGPSGGSFGTSNSNKSGNFGRSSSGRPSGFGDFGSDRRSTSFGDFGSNQPSRFVNIGSGSSGGSRSPGVGRSSLFGGNNSN